MKYDLAQLGKSRNGHSIFSPSGSANWLNCSGALIPNIQAPDTAGWEAAEGTVAHEVAEIWIKSGERPDHIVGLTKTINASSGETYEITIDDDMLDWVEQYVKWCVNLPGHHFTEVRVDFSELTPIPDQGGTSDHIAIFDRRMVVTDLKYGKNVFVEVFQNSQALLYAYGAFLEYDDWYEFEEIEIRICQPRMYNFGVYTVTRAELLAFGEYVKARAKLAWDFNAKRTPSVAACQWCKVSATCAALATVQDTMAAHAAFDDDTADEAQMALLKSRTESGLFSMHAVDAKTLTTEQMARLLPYKRLMENWWHKLAEELKSRANDGEYVPGHKMVSGRGRRVMADADTVTGTLADYGIRKVDLIEVSVKTVTEVEEMLRRKKVPKKERDVVMTRITHREEGQPTLAPESDRRPSLREVVSSEFGPIED